MSGFGIISGSRDHARRPCMGRRARRGALLLAAALGLTLWALFMSWGAGWILEQRRQQAAAAQADTIAAIAADYDFFVFENATGLVGEMSSASAAALSPSRLIDFLGSHVWLGGFPAADDTGFSIRVGSVNVAFGIAQNPTEQLPVGILALSAAQDAPPNLIVDVVAQLTARAGRERTESILTRQNAGEVIIGRTMDDDTVAMSTPFLSGIDPDLVLRTARAGHEDQTELSTDIQFDAVVGDILDVRDFAAGTADVSGCDSGVQDCAQALTIDVIGDFDGEDVQFAGELFVSGDGLFASADFTGVSSRELGLTDALTVASAQSTRVDIQSGSVGAATVQNAVATTLVAGATQLVPELIVTRLIGPSIAVTGPIATGLIAVRQAVFGNLLVRDGCTGC